MLTHGQITEGEAAGLGVGVERTEYCAGDVRRLCNDTYALAWVPVADLDENPQPAGWWAGVPNAAAVAVWASPTP